MQWGDPLFSAALLGGYLGLQTLFWGGLLASTGSWHRQNALPSVPPLASPVPAAPLPPPDRPLLSVCIPARNEAHQIRACLEAALAQTGCPLEVILIDDNSTDDTAAIARSISDPRLHVRTGAALPPGWAGKNWAVSQAAAAATGDLLLFLDADVVLAPEAAARAVAVLRARQHAMLSLFGTWRLITFWEQVAIPVIGWFIRGTIDVPAINDPARREAFANGQFILVDAAAYRQSGGHTAIRDTVLDDVRLARLFKQQGLSLGLYHAPGLFTVRLYRNLNEIIQGYTKNFYEGMDRSPQIALGALLFVFIVALLPWLLLPAALLQPSILLTGLPLPPLWQGWIALTCVLPMAFRYRLERSDGRSGAFAWSHPLGNLILGWILLRSLTQVRTEWKGRVFVDGRIDAPADRRSDRA